MPDSPSTRSVRPEEPPEDADREARIEQLLVTGLDHYVAAQYERAISVWTRVVFLDRHHDRARAYIERARAALAERQRKSEECLHDGMSAYNAGDVERARDLLTRALEQGSDAAGVFLGRLDRVGVSELGRDVRTEAVPRGSALGSGQVAVTPSRGGWAAAALVAVVVAVTMLVSGLPIGTWLYESQAREPTPIVGPVPAEPLPLVRAATIALERARGLEADGRLRDALRVLDGIGLADPDRAEADRLRAEIQRDLLVAAGIANPFPQDAGSRP